MYKCYKDHMWEKLRYEYGKLILQLISSSIEKDRKDPPNISYQTQISTFVNFFSIELKS